jgi:hypothetical protein
VIDDELHRHRCETRQLLRWTVEHGPDWARGWLAGVAQKRGAAAADRLREDGRRQWSLGNRGARGDWREVEAAA